MLRRFGITLRDPSSAIPDSGIAIPPYGIALLRSGSRLLESSNVLRRSKTAHAEGDKVIQPFDEQYLEID